MAILTGDQLAELRRGIAGEAVSVNWSKSTANAATQAIEDWYEAQRASLGAQIDSATSPFVFTNSQKKSLGKFWLKQKFGRGG
jgi:hypothetical protein